MSEGFNRNPRARKTCFCVKSRKTFGVFCALRLSDFHCFFAFFFFLVVMSSSFILRRFQWMATISEDVWDPRRDLWLAANAINT